MSTLKKLTAVGVSVLVGVLQTYATVIYDNSTTDKSIQFNTGTYEVGDQVSFAAGPRELSKFVFTYWTSASLSGDEKLQVTLYKNDGALVNGSASPSTTLYYYEFSSIEAGSRREVTFDATDFATYTGGPPIVLPETVTWSAKFINVDGSEKAGLDIFDPPSVGTAVGGSLEGGVPVSDYWEKNGSSWTLRTIDSGTTPANFGAQITAVPEAPTYWAGLVALLAIVFRQIKVAKRSKSHGS